MSYTELEHGYQGLRKHRRSSFFLGDANPMRSSMRRDEYCDDSDDDSYDSEKKQVIVGICAMEKKSQSKPMKEILTRLEEFEYIKVRYFSTLLLQLLQSSLKASKLTTDFPKWLKSIRKKNEILTNLALKI